ncbi:DUF1980 domain-containing protein [Microbacterium kribbense]
MTRRDAAWNRWVGVGLAACLAVTTLGLALTGRLALYVNPSSNWFVITMALLLLAGAVLSFLLPLGAEAEHGHDHGHAGSASARAPHGAAHGSGAGHATGSGNAHTHDLGHDPARHPRPSAGAIFGLAGGVVATGVVAAVLVLPPASLSAQIAQSRDVGAAPLFAGADVLALATHGDTTKFGVGDWASVFATATNPAAFEGDPVTLTGFVTPGSRGFELTRLVITHCVIDAQTASVPVEASGTASQTAPKTGAWVTVTGTVRSAADGTLEIAATGLKRIPEPKDPYEY